MGIGLPTEMPSNLRVVPLTSSYILSTLRMEKQGRALWLVYVRDVETEVIGITCNKEGKALRFHDSSILLKGIGPDWQVRTSEDELNALIDRSQFADGELDHLAAVISVLDDILAAHSLKMWNMSQSLWNKVFYICSLTPLESYSALNQAFTPDQKSEITVKLHDFFDGAWEIAENGVDASKDFAKPLYYCHHEGYVPGIES